MPGWSVRGEARWSVPARVSSLGEYLKELEKSKSGKPDQVKEGLEIYLDMWKRAVKKGVVSLDDGVEKALAKIDEAGGLYKAAEG